MLERAGPSTCTLRNGDLRCLADAGTQSGRLVHATEHELTVALSAVVVAGATPSVINDAVPDDAIMSVSPWLFSVPR